MVDLPKKKVGIVACSGEELAEGTVTRLAALRVLEQLRPADTVTICLPLFLAGGEGDRAFARFYPTVAVDGCELRCAARATELYSGKPAASLVVNELVAENGLEQPIGLRRLNVAGQQAVNLTAARLAEMVDDLVGRKWDRKKGEFKTETAALTEMEFVAPPVPQEEVQATCACGSGIPIQRVEIAGETVTLVGLPLIFQQFQQAGKPASDEVCRELLDVVKIYNPVPASQEGAYAKVLLHEYAAFCAKQEVTE